jgi:hypothetical protein
MSGRFNGFLVGVGETPLILKEEPDPKNLNAHLLEPLVGAFEKACQVTRGLKSSREAFEHFFERRAELIGAQLVRWEEELRDKNPVAEIGGPQPAVRLLTEVSRTIRGLGYAGPITDRLIRLFELPGISMRTKPVKGATFTMSYQRKTAEGKRPVSLRLDVRPAPADVDKEQSRRELRLTLWDQNWIAEGTEALAGAQRIPADEGVGRFRFGAESSVAQVTEVLDWIANQVSKETPH